MIFFLTRKPDIFVASLNEERRRDILKTATQVDARAKDASQADTKFKGESPTLRHKSTLPIMISTCDITRSVFEDEIYF